MGDVVRGGAVPQPAHQALQALQVYCDLRDHAKEWRGSPHGQLMLLG